MSDDLKNSGQQHISSIINVHEKCDVDYWTRELGVTEEKLVAAVLAAGTAVKSVRYHLGR